MSSCKHSFDKTNVYLTDNTSKSTFKQKATKRTTDKLLFIVTDLYRAKFHSFFQIKIDNAYIHRKLAKSDLTEMHKSTNLSFRQVFSWRGANAIGNFYEFASYGLSQSYKWTSRKQAI